MKKLLAIAWGLALLASVAAAPIWEGSAVAGGAGDFPDDGLYGACNSFPRDAKIEVRNLENGKSVTVTITRNVENPGVFIALSPKAALELGMRSGSAARIRAVALSLSTAQASLPPPQAGTSTDPDFNPKVFVTREKAAAAAATAATAPAPSPVLQPTEAAPAVAAPAIASAETEAIVAAPAAPAETAPVIAAAEPAPAETEAAAVEPAPAEAAAVETTPAETEPIVAAPAEPAETAPVIAAAEPAPAPTEPAPAEAAAVETAPAETIVAVPAETAATEAAPTEIETAPIETAAVENVPAEAEPLPAPEATAEAAPEIATEAVVEAEPEARPAIDEPSRDLATGSQNAPRPGPVGMNLPSPDESPAPVSGEAPEKRIFPDILPDLYGDSIPKARLSSAPAFGLLAPGIVEGGRSAASSVGVLRPPMATEGGDEALYEPEPSQPSPDSLPPSLLTRLEAPPWVDPEGGLGENDIDMSAIIAANTAETTPLEQPSAEVAVADASLAEPSPSTPSPAEPFGAAPAGAEPEAPPAAPVPVAETVPLEMPSTEEEPKAAIAGNGNLPAPATVEAGMQELPPEPTETTVADTTIIEPSVPVAESGGEVLVGLEPTAPRPPSLEPEATIASLPPVPKAETPAPSEAQALAVPAFLGSLAKGSYYVQIGVFGSLTTLEGIMRGYSSLYPFVVEKANLQSGAPVYRLYIGPLTRDESGTVLMKIKAMGVKDAFLKKGS